MASLNKVLLIGRVGQDPELRYTQQGTAVCNLSLATSKQYKDQQGQKQEKTEWHKIVCWKKTAEFVGQYVTKGRLLYVEGELQTQEWQDQQGQKRYTTEINAFIVNPLDKKPEGQQAAPTQQQSPPQYQPQGQTHNAQGFPNSSENMEDVLF